MVPLSPELFASPIWLAPMAGVTDKAFRTLCIEHGARVTFSEMISAKALDYGNRRTLELFELAPAEKRIAVQLFGHEPDVMARQAVNVAQVLGPRLAFIDVNMGCPVGKVCKKGEGAALMKTPQLAFEIIHAMSCALDPLGVSVTAKFRSGWSHESINALEFGAGLEQAGAAAVGVHGRTATQRYSGTADWDIIAQVAGALSIPVIGSGDVMSHADACTMMESCGVKAVFAARGARGNPWIFTGSVPTPAQRLDAALRHLDLYVSFYGEEHLSPLRAQLSYYVHGLKGASDIRRQLGDAQCYQDYRNVFERAGEYQ